MNDASMSITLSEWETLGPTECKDLVGRFFDSSASVRHVIERLSDGSLLNITELRNGLQIKAFSHVGRIQVGNLNLTILPKIQGKSLLSLVRYAYGFRRLNVISDSMHLVDKCGFEDLLISQLNTEVQELISRGLLRSYIPTNERLSSPRGRIDLKRMALDGGIATASLPCVHHPRIEDTLLNRVLMAGLKLAATMAGVIELRRNSLSLASLMNEHVKAIRLDGIVLDRAFQKINRLTTAYDSALSIIRMLMEAKGVVLEGHTNTTTLPGFLFDMNAFFQSLISRFLRDNLTGYTLCDEQGLKGMLRYNPKFNPQRRQSPTPRPDYIVTHQGAIRSILDAKYRDLWEKKLPREMLYQLVVYAISHRMQQSSIIYPTMDTKAKEARIQVTDPVFGKFLGQVCLRPIHLPTIVELVANQTLQGRREREILAKRLVFGEAE